MEERRMLRMQNVICERGSAAPQTAQEPGMAAAKGELFP